MVEFRNRIMFIIRAKSDQMGVAAGQRPITVSIERDAGIARAGPKCHARPLDDGLNLARKVDMPNFNGSLQQRRQRQVKGWGLGGIKQGYAGGLSPYVDFFEGKLILRLLITVPAGVGIPHFSVPPITLDVILLRVQQ
ncbi:hypothetical protein FDECE_6317 [Fusarium decemcellulare]|nr:hypothetical protein FDECE_6317 [Fusarium decemcellulare]